MNKLLYAAKRIILFLTNKGYMLQKKKELFYSIVAGIYKL